MRVALLPISILALSLAGSAASALTARDLSGRIRIDGYTDDYIVNDEQVFGVDPVRGIDQEGRNDSQWQNNEVYQIRVTWDAQNLYVAGEGKIWGNNMILFFDTVPDRGLQNMTNLNSWRRNFTFDPFARFAGDEFLPDVFAATWDGNTSPRYLTQLAGNQVDDQQVGPNFVASATFDQGNDGRAMELAIPWRTLFAGLAGVGTRDTLITVGGVTDTLRRMPIGVHSIKVSAVVTGGGDGTGGPDSAPDNLRGHSSDGNAPVVIDNYATIDLDQNDDTGLGNGGPDGIADWGVSPKSRVTFRYAPPITPVRFSIRDMSLNRPAFAPERGDKIKFHVGIGPPLDPDEPIDLARRVTFTANVFDANGRFVKNLFINQNVQAISADRELDESGLSQWDGRDAGGNLVRPGIYILRVVIEPNLGRATRALVVVR